ncbi:MAG: hypothetical protein IPP30_04345 [Flavobacterium sp.]|nr:hypothetical protein [Flavobacterium sp.]
MTPTPSASTVIEDDDFTFLKYIVQSRIWNNFRTQGIGTSGGVIYSPASMPKVQFRTNNNLPRMTISDVGM